MRIISQNREISIDEFNYTISVSEKLILAMHYGIPNIVLGEYSTKNRAIEVFDELHAAYEESIVFRMPKE